MIVFRNSIVIFFLFSFRFVVAQHIDRKQLVERHTIVNTRFDPLSSLSVGNGKFAFTVDVTGLQSFPDAYAKGVPLGTQSEWGWHSFPNKEGAALNAQKVVEGIKDLKKCKLKKYLL